MLKCWPCPQLEAAPRGKERKAAQAELERASARLAKYRGRSLGGGGGNGGADGVPRVEVGCLEEVIGKMEADTSGEWGSVMFIPKGAAAAGDPLACMRLLPCSLWRNGLALRHSSSWFCPL